MKITAVAFKLVLSMIFIVPLLSCNSDSSNQISGEEHAHLTQAPYLPPAITRTHPTKVIIDLEVKEIIKPLADGVEYVFWTFGGDVPGSFIRIREGDLVEFHLHNHPLNKLPHNIDLHAVTGPGGGAASSFTAPGHTSIFSFTAINPGLFVYHCATAPVGMHIANGMYGLILVEPKEGLPKVDREYYVMQGEFYTEGNYGEAGLQPFSMQKALTETPDYVVFNGSVGALVGDASLKANVGESVRLYIGNGGPNLISSFHVIGEIFDLVYLEGGSNAIQKNVQTTLVPAGGATIVEFKVEVPGNFIMVDHSIFRAFNKGASGMITVSGRSQTEIYSGKQKDELYSGGSNSVVSGVNPFTGELLKNTPKQEYISKYSKGESKVDERLLKTAMSGSDNTSSENLFNLGQTVYNMSCVACHQADGKGIANVFPPLAGSDWLNTHSKEDAIRNVIMGRTGELTVNNKVYNGIMPPQNIDDTQSAAVLTYVYKKFAGKDISVTANDVKKVRAEKK